MTGRKIAVKFAQDIRDAHLSEDGANWVCDKYPHDAADAIELLPIDSNVDDAMLEFVQLLIDYINAPGTTE